MQAQGPNYRIVATWVLMVWLDATAPLAVFGQQVAPSLQDASVLAKAWSALATGRPSEVEPLVAPLRVRVPRHRDAWIVTVTARAAQAAGQPHTLRGVDRGSRSAAPRTCYCWMSWR